MSPASTAGRPGMTPKSTPAKLIRQLLGRADAAIDPVLDVARQHAVPIAVHVDGVVYPPAVDVNCTRDRCGAHHRVHTCALQAADDVSCRADRPKVVDRAQVLRHGRGADA